MSEHRTDALVSWAARELADSGIDNPRREARLLLAHHMGQSVEQLIAFPERPVDAIDAFKSLIARRANREPLSHITGQREFWSLAFEVSRNVLDPRPDSETLIEAVLGAIADKSAPLRIVDFGTGSGCLLLTLLSELPNATGVAVDISADALAVAQRNAERHNLSNRCRFLLSNWAESLDGSFDIVISNPPYIETASIDQLEPEVANFEPVQALDGGADGLAAYRILIPQAKNILSSEGFIALELGQGQDPTVTALLEEAGLKDVAVHKDLAGIPRCLTAKCASRP